MPLILNIETATKNCSVSLAKNGKTIAIAEVADQNYSHAEKLHAFIGDLLSENNLEYSNLNAVAVSQGPGSYTGLRIGVSAAKGLCYALDIPLIAINTLNSIAAAKIIETGYLIPMIDARRQEVYMSVFNSNMEEVQPTSAQIIDVTSFEDLEGEIHFLGDGCAKFKGLFTDSRFVFHNDVPFPSASQMSKLSFEKFQLSSFEDVAYFEPYYFKDFIVPTKKK